MSTKYLGNPLTFTAAAWTSSSPTTSRDRPKRGRPWTGKPGVLLIHGNMLTVNGRKMSKSEGNGFTPDELITGNHKLLEKGYSPMTVRFFMLQGHYAGTLDFSNPALQAAEKGLERLAGAWKLTEDLQPVAPEKAQTQHRIWQHCRARLCGDERRLNTPILIAVLYDAVKVVNSWRPAGWPWTLKGEAKSLFADFAQDILGLEQKEKKGGTTGPTA